MRGQVDPSRLYLGSIIEPGLVTFSRWTDRNLDIWGYSFFLRIISIYSSTIFHTVCVFRVVSPVFFFLIVVIQMHYSSGSATAEVPPWHTPEIPYSLISDSLVSFKILGKPKTPSNLSTFECGAQFASPRTNVCVRTIGHGRCLCRGPTLTRSPSFGVWWTAAGRMTIQTWSIFGHFHCFTFFSTLFQLFAYCRINLFFGIVRFSQNGFLCFFSWHFSVWKCCCIFLHPIYSYRQHFTCPDIVYRVCAD